MKNCELYICVICLICIKYRLNVSGSADLISLTDNSRILSGIFMVKAMQSLYKTQSKGL
jgi:hypothetical protein